MVYCVKLHLQSETSLWRPFVGRLPIDRRNMIPFMFYYLIRVRYHSINYYVTLSVNIKTLSLISCISSYIVLSLPRTAKSLQIAASVSLLLPRHAHWVLTCAGADGASQATCSCPHCHGGRGRGRGHLMMRS